MKALALVGDSRVQGMLERLIRNRADTFHVQVVRDAAKECLNLLKKEAALASHSRRTLHELFGSRNETLSTLALQEPFFNSLGPERAKLALVPY